MWKALLASLFVLAFSGMIDARGTAHADSPRLEAGIARFKAALRLTPAQQRHWPRVEAALRSIASDSERTQVADASGQQGFLRRVGSKATEMALNAASMRRLVAAAQPLLKSLDDDQKREAMQLARAMGFGHVAARLQ